MHFFIPVSVAAGFLLLGAGFANATELVTNGDFSAGKSGFSSDYDGSPLSCGGHGSYSVGTNPAAAPNACPDWQNFGDHTTGSGNMLIADGSTISGARVWFQTITVTAGTSYAFSFWGHEVHGTPGTPADLALEIDGVQQGTDLLLPTSGAGTAWEEDSGSYTAASSGTVTLSIVDLQTAADFNDFALDDISFDSQPTTTPVPEPSSSAVLLGSLFILAVGSRLRRSEGTALR